MHHLQNSGANFQNWIRYQWKKSDIEMECEEKFMEHQ